MADRRLPYYAEPEANVFLDARDVRVDPDGKEVVRQRVTADGEVAVTNFPATQPVSGTVAVSNPTPAPEVGLAKDARLIETRDNVTAAVTRLEAIRDLTATAARQDVQTARIEAVRDRLPPALDPDGGLPAHIQNFPASQPVTGPLTDAQLRAAAVPTIGPLTDAQLRASRVPVDLPPLPAGPNNIGFVSPSTSQKVGQGRFNLAGSGRITLTVAGNVRATITNPAGSGKTVSIVRIASFSTGVGWASILLNPTSGLPDSPARPVLNAVAGGGVPPVLQLKVDTHTTVPLSGGTDTGIVIGIPGGSRTQLDMPPLVIAPGVSMGLNIPFAGAGDVAMSCYWIED